MEKSKGIVVSGYGGFYQVRLTGGHTVDCKPRGRLKKEFSKIYVGDRVEIELLTDGTVMIESIGPRTSCLSRPNVVNIDRLLIVLAWAMPEYDLLLLDRMLVIAQKAGIKPLVCFNKIDLLKDEDMKRLVKIKTVYEQAGFPFFTLSAINDQGICELRAHLARGISVMAGQSGVGKSSLLNRLLPEENAQVGEVSDRLRQGKHTTRYTRILPLPCEEGYITDTPGFSIIDLPGDFTAGELPMYYPDFHLKNACRFDGCLHDKEPDCAIKEAVESGKIDQQRYQRYLRLLAEIQEKEVRY